MKYFILSLCFIFTGCSFGVGGPSKATVLSIYKEYRNSGVLDVEEVECSKAGYGLPDEKEWPIYDCQVTVRLANNEIGYDEASFIYQGHWNLRYSLAIERLRMSGRL